MSRVVCGMTVSADGYIAGPGDGPDEPLGAGGRRLFDWYFSGDVPSRVYGEPFAMSAVSAEFFDRSVAAVGAIVTGRRTYDIAGGWGGGSPLPGAPLFVLSHRPAPSSASPAQTFVSDGIEAAVALAREAAGERDVGLQSSGPLRAALGAGLLDVLALSIVPVLLGGGVRLLDGIPAELQVAEVIDAPGVTHVVYDVGR